MNIQNNMKRSVPPKLKTGRKRYSVTRKGLASRMQVRVGSDGQFDSAHWAVSTAIATRTASLKAQSCMSRVQSFDSVR